MLGTTIVSAARANGEETSVSESVTSSSASPALELPRFDDLVYIGEGAGGIYRYEPMEFRVFDAAPLPDGYLAMTGYRVPGEDDRDENGIPYDPIRHTTVLVRWAGVELRHRSTVLDD